MSSRRYWCGQLYIYGANLAHTFLPPANGDSHCSSFPKKKKKIFLFLIRILSVKKKKKKGVQKSVAAAAYINTYTERIFFFFFPSPCTYAAATLYKFTSVTYILAQQPTEENIYKEPVLTNLLVHTKLEYIFIDSVHPSFLFFNFVSYRVEIYLLNLLRKGRKTA